jgi:hypothetical protein
VIVQYFPGGAVTLTTQDRTQEEDSQAEGHTQTLNLDDWIITCKEYKPGRRKLSNK